jgi:hypothetical protein
MENKITTKFKVGDYIKDKREWSSNFNAIYKIIDIDYKNNVYEVKQLGDKRLNVFHFPIKRIDEFYILSPNHKFKSLIKSIEKEHTMTKKWIVKEENGKVISIKEDKYDDKIKYIKAWNYLLSYGEASFIDTYQELLFEDTIDSMVKAYGEGLDFDTWYEQELIDSIENKEEEKNDIEDPISLAITKLQDIDKDEIQKWQIEEVIDILKNI